MSLTPSDYDYRSFPSTNLQRYENALCGMWGETGFLKPAWRAASAQAYPDGPVSQRFIGTSGTSAHEQLQCSDEEEPECRNLADDGSAFSFRSYSKCA